MLRKCVCVVSFPVSLVECRLVLLFPSVLDSEMVPKGFVRTPCLCPCNRDSRDGQIHRYRKSKYRKGRGVESEE